MVWIGMRILLSRRYTKHSNINRSSKHHGINSVLEILDDKIKTMKSWLEIF